MVYVKPSTNDSDINGALRDGQRRYVAVDSTNQYENRHDPANIVATEAGYGVRYRVVGDSDGADNARFDIEILDALPLRKILDGRDTTGATDSDLLVYDSDTEALTVTTNEYVKFSVD